MEQRKIDMFCQLEPKYMPFFSGEVLDSKGNKVEDFHAFNAVNLFGGKIDDYILQEDGSCLNMDMRREAKIGLFKWLYGEDLTLPKNADFNKCFPNLSKSLKDEDGRKMIFAAMYDVP